MIVKLMHMSHVDIPCNTEIMYFNENQDLTPMIPNNPRLTFDPINMIEGLKLMHMYELHGCTM